MSRTGSAVIGLGACFLLVLLVVTLRSTSTPLGLEQQDRDAGQRLCQGAVRERMADARFPHDANLEARGQDRLFLSGSVDGGSPEQPVRRNYECVLRRDGSGAFVADSIRVWQSH